MKGLTKALCGLLVCIASVLCKGQEQPAVPVQGNGEASQQTPSSATQNPPDATTQAAPEHDKNQPRDPNVPVLKRRPVKKRSHKKASSSSSGKVVVRNGGAKEGSPELAPGSSKEQAQHDRENTSQLLATTDANLKSLSGRQLTPAQQSMREQIRTYMSQSKEATDAGDLERAHTLAYKAHLLSDELAKK